MVLKELLRKDLKLLLRYKWSSSVIIFGPVLLILLLGLTLSQTQVYTLNIGVYSANYSQTTESFLEKLTEEKFNLKKINSEEECVNAVKLGETNACLLFPPNLEITEEGTEIDFYIDFSKINLANAVIEIISKELGNKTTEIGENLAAVLINKLDELKKDLKENKNITLILATKEQEEINSLSGIDSQLQEVKNKISGLKGYELAQMKLLMEDYNQTVEEALTTLSQAQEKLDQIQETSTNKNMSDGVRTLFNVELTAATRQISSLYLKIKHFQEIGLTGEMNIQTEITAAVNKLDEINSFLGDEEGGIKKELNQVIQNLQTMKNELEQLKTRIEGMISKIEAIEVKSPEKIISPVTTKIKPIVPEKTPLNYLFPSLVMLIMMFVGLLLGSTLILREKKSPAYFRNSISPVKNIVLILGSFLTTIWIIFLQLLVVILVSMFFFQVELSNLPDTLLILLITSTVFVLIGMLIGHIFKSEETSTLAAISLGIILILISGIIIPIELFPKYFISIVKVNPLVLGESMLRQILLFNISLKAMSTSFFILTLYLFVLVIFLLYLTKNLPQKHFLELALRQQQKRMKEKEHLEKHGKKKKE